MKEISYPIYPLQYFFFGIFSRTHVIDINGKLSMANFQYHKLWVRLPMTFSCHNYKVIKGKFLLRKFYPRDQETLSDRDNVTSFNRCFTFHDLITLLDFFTKTWGISMEHFWRVRLTTPDVIIFGISSSSPYWKHSWKWPCWVRQPGRSWCVCEILCYIVGKMSTNVKNWTLTFNVNLKDLYFESASVFACWKVMVNRQHGIPMTNRQDKNTCIALNDIHWTCADREDNLFRGYPSTYPSGYANEIRKVWCLDTNLASSRPRVLPQTTDRHPIV